MFTFNSHQIVVVHAKEHIELIEDSSVPCVLRLVELIISLPGPTDRCVESVREMLPHILVCTLW